MKSKDKEISGFEIELSLIHKSECVNGIKLISQYIWKNAVVKFHRIRKNYMCGIIYCM